MGENMGFKQIWNNIKRYKLGIAVGALVGIASAVAYKITGGDFMFAVADIQSRTAGLALNQQEAISFAYVTTVLSWIIIGAIIGFVIDWKYGFKFSQKTKRWLLITALILLAYILFGDTNLGRAGGPGSGKLGTLGTLGKMGWPFATILFVAVTGIFSFFKALIAPSPTIPIWIFFVAGFMILLFLRKGGGGGEQPLIIQR